jgi:hypothetical protein
VYWTWITSFDGALSRVTRTLSTVAFNSSKCWPTKNRCMPLRGGALFGARWMWALIGLSLCF